MNQARRKPRFAAGRARTLGLPTRGTTNPNRLRRVDRWMAANLLVAGVLRRAEDPLVIHLGYGASPVTTVEMAQRLRPVRADLRMLGLEIDAERVAAGVAVARPPLLEFRRGGFELAGRAPVLVRAFNVLRQYTEEDTEQAWRTILDGLAPGGLLVEGTCDEIGRRCCWVTLDASGPQTMTFACLPADLEAPSELAERLPKSLIHRNIPGERVHDLLSDLDSCWANAAPFVPFGPRARWAEAIRLFAERGC